MPGIEEEKIQKITRLLEKGGTMLATHHECGAPMFRFQGKVVCPICDLGEKKEIEKQLKQVQKKEKPDETKDTERKNEENSEASNKIARTEPVSTGKLSIEGQVNSIITELAATLSSETDLGRLKQKLDCIETGERILKLIR